jgi:hypothetical protein
MLAHLAAEALGHAGLTAQADQAYARAGDLWRDLGNIHGLVRSLRARAWAAARVGGELDEARELMGAAVRECESAVGGTTVASGSSAVPPAVSSAVSSTVSSAVSSEEDARRRLVAELGHTWRQFGDLVARSVPKDAAEAAAQTAFAEALGHITRAISVFASLGDEVLDARTGAELAAGWLEADLGRPGEAAARARAVLSACAGLEGEVAEDRRAEAERMRELMGAAETR